MLSRDTGIERSQILLTEIDDLTFHRTFKDSDPVTVINANKPNPSCHLFCIGKNRHRQYMPLKRYDQFTLNTGCLADSSCAILRNFCFEEIQVK